MSNKISHLPDGNTRLEKAMARFWRSEGISFPSTFNLGLSVLSFQQGKKPSDNQKSWMRERHGEGAEALRAATRAAFAAVGR